MPPVACVSCWSPRSHDDETMRCNGREVLIDCGGRALTKFFGGFSPLARMSAEDDRGDSDALLWVERLCREILACEPHGP